jgi:hypothetical protein
MGGTVQKWLFYLVGLGALGMILANPNAVYRAGQAIRGVTAGSIVDVTTGKSRA